MKKVSSIILYTISPLLLNIIMTGSLIKLNLYNRNLGILLAPFTYLISYLMFKFINNYDFSFFDDFKFNKRDYLYIFITVILSILLNYVFYMIIPKNEGQAISNLINDKEIWPWVFPLTTMILAPICEELYFRKGYKLIIENKIIYIILNSLIFSFWHYNVNSSFFANLNVLLSTFFVSIILSYVYIKSDKSGTNILSHMISNILAFI